VPKIIKLGCTLNIKHTHPLGWRDGDNFGIDNYPYGTVTDPGTELYDSINGAVKDVRTAVQDGIDDLNALRTPQHEQDATHTWLSDFVFGSNR
jgi:hypothetical protein